jgi:nitrogen regulatory protein PII
MKKIEAQISAARLGDLMEALTEVSVQGVTARTVRVYGAEKGSSIWYQDNLYSREYSPELKVEIVVTDTESARVLAMLEAMAASGRILAGDLLLQPCEECVRIGTSEISVAAR